MIELAKMELGRGRRDRVQRTLDAEQLEPREARAEVVEELERMLGIDQTPDEPTRVSPWEAMSNY